MEDRELLEKELLSKDYSESSKNEDDALAVNINEFTSGLNFEHSVEKYQDNMSTAVTFFLCGIGGLVFLVLNWFDVIKVITGKSGSSIVIYVSLAVLFIIFIGIAIYSIKAANGVKGKIQSETDYSDKIEEWVEDHVIPEVVDASFDGSNLPTEIKYFERSAFLTRVIKNEFPDAPDDLVDSIVDDYIEQKFHILERALAEEAAAEEETEDDDSDDEE